jgi:hypothetical protein
MSAAVKPCASEDAPLADWKFKNRNVAPTKRARVSDFSHAVEIDIIVFIA